MYYLFTCASNLVTLLALSSKSCWYWLTFKLNLVNQLISWSIDPNDNYHTETGCFVQLVNLFFKVLFCRSHPSAENADLFLLLSIDVCLQDDFKRFIILRVMRSIARRQEHNCCEKFRWNLDSQEIPCLLKLVDRFDVLHLQLKWGQNMLMYITLCNHDKCAASADWIIRHKILQITNGSKNFVNDGINLTLI